MLTMIAAVASVLPQDEEKKAAEKPVGLRGGLHAWPVPASGRIGPGGTPSPVCPL